MAEGGFDLVSQVQGRLLVCEVCLDKYDTQGHIPRVLPCHHAFCTACLQQLRRDGLVRCPTCRQESRVKGAFPVETSRMELLDLVAQAKAGLPPPPNSEQERCQPHQKKLEFSCSDCKTFLCSKCAVFLHKGHDVQDLEPLVEQLRKQIEAVSERLQAAMPTFQGRVERSGVTLRSMERSHTEAAAWIRAIFSVLVAKVQAKERQILKDLQAEVGKDRAVLEEEHHGDQTLLKEAKAQMEAAQAVASLQGSPSLLKSQVLKMERSCSQLEERASLSQLSAPAYQVGTGDESALTAALKSFGSISVKPREALPEPICRSFADMGTQKTRISGLLNKTLKKGDVWYLLDIVWFKQWKKYVGYDSRDTSSVGEMGAHPGCIDNSPLFKSESGELREGLIKDLEYVLLPEEAWLDLMSWYGPAKGAQPVARKVIEQGIYVKHCKVEVYLLDLKLAQHSNPNTFITRQFSRSDSVHKLEEEMREVFHIPQEVEVRLRKRYMSNTYKHLNKPDASLEDAGLYQGQIIVIEKKNPNGSWPRQS